MGLLNTLQFVLSHPLNRNRKLTALSRLARWQIGSRLLPGPVVVDFVDQSKLLIEPGMAGATGNIYTGLHEFWEMAFTLHALREGDLFVDVGANVGVYTVLASAAAGARSVSFEPIPETCEWLAANVQLNGISSRVDVRPSAVGERRGTVNMTASLGPVNHVIVEAEKGADVPVQTLDGVLRKQHPVLLKIDVEGYEGQVLAGARKTLEKDSLLAAIVEIGSEARYGYDADTTLDLLENAGFRPFEYDPLKRRLRPRKPVRLQGRNVLFVKKAKIIEKRVKEAKTFHLNTGAQI